MWSLSFLILPFCLSLQPLFELPRRTEAHIVLAVLHTPKFQAKQSPKKPRERSAPSSEKTDDAVLESENGEARRVYAVSMIMSLTDEARSYKDLALRARVLAQSADTLWDTDPHGARILFRQAWEAAEKADAADIVETSSNDRAPVMVIAQRRSEPSDSRSEVLNLAARRDRTLAEEFLAKLIDAAAKTSKPTQDHPQISNDGWTTSDDVSKRIRLAHRLLDEREPEKAFEFAAPVLERVSEETISFLCRLRLVKPALADNQFLLLLAQAEMDPSTDANTVSGLSTYAITPGLYVTFLRDGGIRWTPTVETTTVPDLPIHVKRRFFRVAGNILLRPLPPLDQDRTSAGLFGKYMITRRLLPLFEQYAPETAVALRSQLAGLAEQARDNVLDEDHFLLKQGIQEADPGTLLENLQERVDRAKSERERDELYAEAAAVLALRGKPDAQNIADKIDNVYRREMARRYVDISLIRTALSKRDAAAALRFAKADSLSNSQRTWAYLQIARLLMRSDQTRALEMLEEALAEARRIDSEDSNRAALMIGVGRQFLTADAVRPWEVTAEAIKAANAAEGFSGEESRLSVALVTSSGLKLIELDVSDLKLAALIRLLAKQDLARAHDLAKSFKYDAPRAVAILAVASAALEKNKGAK